MPIDSEAELLDQAVIDWHSEELFYDPKQIHAYFQAKKKTLNHKLFNAGESHIKWIINSKCISTKDQAIVKLPGKENFYVLIDSKLANSLDKATLLQFQNALTKGIITKHYSNNGIKLLGKKLFELKIDGDTRLCSDILYKNLSGNNLIIFTKKCNHQEVAKLAQKSVLKIECVSDEVLIKLSDNNSLIQLEANQESALTTAPLEPIIKLAGDTAEEENHEGY